MSLDEKIRQLDQQIAELVQHAVSDFHQDIKRRLSDEVLPRLEEARSLLPTSFIGPEGLAPIAEGAVAEGRRNALESLRDAVVAVDRARSQAEVLRTLLAESGRFSSRAVLFLTRPEGATGWGSEGFGDAGTLVNGMPLAYEAGRPWAKLAHAQAAIELEAADCAELCSRLESPVPQRGALVPLVLRDRVAAALYADQTDGGRPLETEGLQALTYVAALAIETLPFRERASTPTLALEGAAAGAAETAGAESQADDGGLEPWDTGAVTLSAGVARGAAAAAALAEEAAESTAAESAEEMDFAAAEAEVEVEVETETEEPVAEESPEPPAPAVTVLEDVATTQPVDISALHPPAKPPEPEVSPVEPELALETDAEPAADDDVLPAAEVLEAEVEVLEIEAEIEPPGGAFEEPPPVGPTADALGWEEDDTAVGRRPEPVIEDVFDAAPEEEPAAPAAEALVWEADEEVEAQEEAAEAEPEISTVTISPEDSPLARDLAATEAAPETPSEAVETRVPPAPAEPESEDAADVDQTVLLERPPQRVPPEPAPPEPAAPPPEPAPPPAEEAPPPAPAAAAGASPIFGAAGGGGGAAQVAPPTDLDGPGWAFSGDRGPEEGDEANHDEAKRLARLLVSEIKLYNQEQVDEGQRNNNIYDRLRDDIDRSRQMYEERVDERVRNSTDYFYQELVKQLAAGDPKALGM